MPRKFEASAVRAILQDAEANGLDPELLYQQAVSGRLDHWPPAPDYEVIKEAMDLPPEETRPAPSTPAGPADV